MTGDAGAAAPGALARTRNAAARVPILVWILLLIGVGLRGQLWLDYHPAVLNLADSGVYVNLAGGDLFADPTRAAGYPLFLRAVHSVSDELELVIALQHLLGIAGGAILYATVRRLGAPVWTGGVAAAAVLLSLDQIFLEHAVMNEALFTFLFLLGLYAAIRGLDAGRKLIGPVTSRQAWIVAAAGAIGLAAWVRPVAAPVIGLLALWFALAIESGWRARVAHAALALASGAAVLLVYFSIHASHTGEFGFSQASGWAFYSRVAPFADCSRFDPPPGTKALCESIPEEERPGPDFYGQQPGSPARQLFGSPPAGNDRLQAFASAALRAQPLSYIEDLGRDVIRYFEPGFAPQDYSGVGYEVVDVDRRAPGTEEFQVTVLNGYFEDDEYAIEPGIKTLGDVQEVLRVHPKLLLLSVVLGLAALVLARERLRWGAALLLSSSLVIMVLAPATAIWSARYAIPADGPLVAAGAIGACCLIERFRTRRTPLP